jgi:shikimate kinase
LLGVGKTEVGKNISTAFLDPDRSFCSRSHVSSAFLCESVRRQPGGDG